MDIIAQTFIGWIERHQAWLPLIMLVFAAAETTAFLSILVPSTAVMVAIGALTATDNIAFFPIWVGATIGALIGSTFSYWLGLRYGGAILAMRPLRSHPEMVEKSRASFVRFGSAAILIGHFMTFLRPVIFLLAGMTRMSLVRFVFWNSIGCALWAFLVPKFGQFGGDIFGWIWAQF